MFHFIKNQFIPLNGQLKELLKRQIDKTRFNLYHAQDNVEYWQAQEALLHARIKRLKTELAKLEEAKDGH